VKLEFSLIEARLRAPVVAAHGDVTLRELVRLTLIDSASGCSGHGEAAPLHSYDGVSTEHVVTALEDCRAVLAGAPPDTPREELLRACASAAVLPQAVAAVDLALWDLEGRRRRQPVWQLLGGPHAGAAPVVVNATVTAADRAGAAAQAARARADGFGALKLKVGLGDDAARLAAVRAAAGPQMAIRLDANGAWTPVEALATLQALEPAEIECCEEPCHGLAEIEHVASGTAVPVPLDESARLPGALESRRCAAVCLKISTCGGITGLLDGTRRARAAGYEVYLASTFDGPLGIAAGLHAAAALSPDRVCGLATLGLFEARDPLPARGGAIALPDGPGLGDGLLDWYRV
jgi:L-Ala-D/L-Glu epimerase